MNAPETEYTIGRPLAYEPASPEHFDPRRWFRLEHRPAAIFLPRIGKAYGHPGIFRRPGALRNRPGEWSAGLPRWQRSYPGSGRQTHLMGKNVIPLIAADRARRGEPATSAASSFGSSA